MPEDTEACVPLLAQGAREGLDEAGGTGAFVCPPALSHRARQSGAGAGGTVARSSRRSPHLCAGLLG